MTEELGLNRKECTLKLITSGNKTHDFRHQKQVQFQLESLDRTYRSPMIHASTAPEISGPICYINLNPQDYPHLKNLEFTEIHPMTESTDKIVDVMIGEPLYSEILEGTPIRGKTYGEPVAQKTKLDYCPARAIQTKLGEVQLVKQFWDLEHIGIHSQKTEHFTLEEELAMEKAQELTIKKDSHWTTGLLWKPEAPLIEEMNCGRASAIML